MYFPSFINMYLSLHHFFQHQPDVVWQHQADVVIQQSRNLFQHVYCNCISLSNFSRKSIQRCTIKTRKNDLIKCFFLSTGNISTSVTNYFRKWFSRVQLNFLLVLTKYYFSISVMNFCYFLNDKSKMEYILLNDKMFTNNKMFHSVWSDMQFHLTNK